MIYQGMSLRSLDDLVENFMGCLGWPPLYGYTQVLDYAAKKAALPPADVSLLTVNPHAPVFF